jgi:conjugal transfer/type IV secretion protein DotA/TraY
LFGSSSGSKQGQAIANNINKGPTLASAAAVIFQGGTRDIGEFLLPAAALFLTLGFTFGYMLPILPFMHFLFGCITWLTVLFEAVIAMPLVALAHINPEGEGLPGQYAREAYFMAFSILLRPVLMIFGLICGFITLMLAVSLLNIFFAHAMTGSTAQDHHTLVKIIYTIIYSVILVSIASHAFHLITFIPDKVMSWIGAHGAKGEPMGNVGAIEEKAAFGAGYLSKEGIPQIGNALPQAAKGIGSGINKLLR